MKDEISKTGKGRQGGEGGGSKLLSASVSCIILRTTMQLLQIELIQTSCDFSDREVVHDVHELVYVLSPGYRVRVDGQTYDGRPGDVFLYPRGRVHKVLMKNDLNARFYCLQWREQSARVSRLPVRVHDSSGRLLLLFQWLWELFPARTAGHRQLVLALWTASRAEYHRLAFSKAISFSDRIRHYMARDLHRPLTLLELAKSEGVSVFHLIRRFRREVGQTPGQHLQHLRVQRALSLLATTTSPLKEVAQAVGFSSPTYLAALMLRETGRHVGSFRRHLGRQRGQGRH